jgi:beta-phosphoglucomutase-like phosphatase (HAD superfamily)
MWKTVLLDIDGTLLDSNAAHSHAWEDSFAEHGYSMPFEAIFRRSSSHRLQVGWS